MERHGTHGSRRQNVGAVESRDVSDGRWLRLSHRPDHRDRRRAASGDGRKFLLAGAAWGSGMGDDPQRNPRRQRPRQGAAYISLPSQPRCSQRLPSPAQQSGAGEMPSQPQRSAIASLFERFGERGGGGVNATSPRPPPSRPSNVTPPPLAVRSREREGDTQTRKAKWQHHSTRNRRTDSFVHLSPTALM